MYEDGIQSLIQGWTKHFSVGANKTQPQIMLAIVMWLMGSITSTLTLLISVFTKPASRIVSYLFYVLYVPICTITSKSGCFLNGIAHITSGIIYLFHIYLRKFLATYAFSKRSNGKVVHLK